MDDVSESPFTSATRRRTSPGISLAENLDRTERHPVLIFGSSAAGKSSLVLSLILGLQTMRDINVSLGDPILDPADPRSKVMHQRAKDTYDRAAYELATGKPVGITIGEPFFIPVDVKPTNSLLEPVKFAFLDGRGEDYQPNEDINADLFRTFKPEIVDVLRSFPHGITVIYVAPYSVGDGHDRDTPSSNFGLLGVMRGYEELRELRRHDSHLFLLTKWDQYATPMDARPLFSDASANDVDRVLRDRYPNSWGTFQALPLEGEAHERRAFMQYSSGYFKDGEYREPPHSFHGTFKRYPRTVMNWLYGNATQYRPGRDNRTTSPRRSLFPDVDVPTAPPRRSLIDLLNHALTAR
ncbi:hypothetical protein SGCZBJ_13210 [Caulobacter zeae]|uniref:Uncharacterized protein n=1 Tax=Caulobacter zeae TaxID=2055137 RepID=A0A2N5DGK1_9CAUL|nr:hypothetical protein [Caulobacter zeae]PLR25182.1 hypothetical protein SGCZBJ_13210 [Caulobacter zeae]